MPKYYQLTIEDLNYQFREKAELRLREALLQFGIGLKVSNRISSDKIFAFPTRRYNLETHKGIWEIDLELSCFISQLNISELLREHLLNQEEFEEWNRQEWEPWL